jgi:GH24 family phage-related lysozyme (muramidase)
MPIKPHIVDNFDDAVFDEIAKRESFRSDVYLDSVGIPTIGYGHAFFTARGDINNQAFNDLKAVGIELSATDVSLFHKMESLMKHSPRDKHAIQKLTNQLTLTVDKVEAKSLFLEAIGHKTKDLERKIGNKLYDELESSKELLSLLDLTYNGGAGILYSSLLKALHEGDRQEVWYKIRYTTNGGASRCKGIANRRVSESNIFGLTNENPSEKEIHQIELMMHRHAANIVQQESAFPVSRRSPSSNPYGGQNSMKEQLKLAKLDMEEKEYTTDIYLDIALLSGVKYKISKGVYADAMFIYTKENETLIVTQKVDPSKSFTIENWDEKAEKISGIELSEERVEQKNQEVEHLLLPESVNTYLDQFKSTDKQVKQHTINVE